MPSVGGICELRSSTRTRTWRSLREFCTKGFSGTRSSYSFINSCNWVERVNAPLTDAELTAVRQCVQRGRPFGEEGWVKSIVRRLGLESTMRPRGRQRARPVPEDHNKEA